MYHRICVSSWVYYLGYASDMLKACYAGVSSVELDAGFALVQASSRDVTLAG